MNQRFGFEDWRVAEKSRLGWQPVAAALAVIVLLAALVTLRSGESDSVGAAPDTSEDVAALRSTGVADAAEQSTGEVSLATAAQQTDEDLLLAAIRGDVGDAIGDAYAGVWLGEDQRLTIGATSSEAVDVVEAMGIAVEAVEYSSAELDETMATLNARATALAGVSTGWYVDLRQNRVSIETDDRDTMLTVLTDLGVDPGLVAFVPEVDRVTLSEIPTTDYWQIGDVALCSFGFGVTGGFVTAGHCLPAGWSGPVQLTDSVQGRLVTNLSEQNADLAFVAVDAPHFVGGNVPDGNGGSTPVLGAEEAPVGAEVCKFGRTTGWTCGAVVSRNQTIFTAAVPFFGQVLANVCSEPGDSGGRVMWGTNAQGVVSTGRTCTDGVGSNSFQPIRPMLDSLGLTLTTGTRSLPGVGAGDAGAVVPVLPGVGAGDAGAVVPVLPGVGARDAGAVVPVLPAPAPTIAAPPTTVPATAPPTTAPPATAPTQAPLPGPFAAPGPFQFASFIPEQDCVSLVGANVVLIREACDPAIHGLVRLEPATDGSGYLIKAEGSNTCWTVDSSSNVTLSACSNDLSQKFTIVQTGHGNQIWTVADSRCVEIQGGATGANIAVAACGSRLDYQSWGSYHYPHLG